MTAVELGLDGPKPVVDLTTGEVWVDTKTGRRSVDGAPRTPQRKVAA
jgi:hypothetical protein